MERVLNPAAARNGVHIVFTASTKIHATRTKITLFTKGDISKMAQNESDDCVVAVSGHAHDDMEQNYHVHRPRVTDDQAGEMLLLFCHYGLSNADIAEQMGIPLKTVRAIISYACSVSLNLYSWHKDATDIRSGKGALPPSNAAAYKHYAPHV